PEPPGPDLVRPQHLVLQQLDRLQRRVTTMADEVEEARGVCGVERIEFVERRGDALPREQLENQIALGACLRQRWVVRGRKDQAVLQRNYLPGADIVVTVPPADRTLNSQRRALLILAVCRATARNHQLPRDGTLLGDQEHSRRRSACVDQPPVEILELFRRAVEELQARTFQCEAAGQWGRAVRGEPPHR